MQRSRVQFRRLIALDERIRSHAYPNCFAFAREWEVSRKTIQRDIEFLRDQLDAPIGYDRERRGYFYSDRNWFLPAVKISEGDLALLLIGVRALEQYKGTPVAAKLDRIFSKVAEALPACVSIRPEEVFHAFSFTGPPSKAVDQGIWTAVVRGLLNRRSIDILYRSFHSQKPLRRRCDPYHVANLQGEWYVFARCHRRNEVRQFAIPRIESAQLTEFEFSLPAGLSVRDRIESAFSRFAAHAPARRVKLQFARPVAKWIADCQWHPTQKLTKLPNGGLEMSFKATGLLEVLRWILGWGRHVRVVEPENLKQAWAAEITAMAAGVSGQTDSHSSDATITRGQERLN